MGHSKSGKSSLLGRLIHDYQGLDIYRNKRDSTKFGFENHQFAWALDTLQQEKKQGCTLSNAIFSMNHAKIFNFYDTPGREDLIGEAISAASISDIALLVIDASIRKHFNEKALVPTKNYAYLARALGINTALVFIAKTDSPKCSEEKIKEIVDNLSGILKQVGFKEENFKFVHGNIFEEKLSEKIFAELTQSQKNCAEDLKPFRLVIEDSFKLVHGKMLGNCVCGYLASGIIGKGQKISIGQGEVQGKIKEIIKCGEKVAKAMAGDWVEVILTELEGDFSAISHGFIANSPEYPIFLAKKIRIRGITNDLSIPLLKKQEFIMCIGLAKVQVTVIQILREIIGKNIKNKPRGLKWKTIGDIDVICHKTIPCEKAKNLQRLGKCLLLSKNKVIFAGMITDILE